MALWPDFGDPPAWGEAGQCRYLTGIELNTIFIVWMVADISNKPTDVSEIGRRGLQLEGLRMGVMVRDPEKSLRNLEQRTRKKIGDLLNFVPHFLCTPFFFFLSQNPTVIHIFLVIKLISSPQIPQTVLFVTYQVVAQKGFKLRCPSVSDIWQRNLQYHAAPETNRSQRPQLTLMYLSCPKILLINHPLRSRRNQEILVLQI